MLFEWAKLQGGKYPDLRLMFHIPNEAKRSFRLAAQLKAEGLKSGVPDILLPVARGRYHGLFIEMKRRKGGVVSAEQKAWLAALAQNGYACEVCRGFEAAKDAVMQYLGGDDDAQ